MLYTVWQASHLLVVQWPTSNRFKIKLGPSLERSRCELFKIVRIQNIMCFFVCLNDLQQKNLLNIKSISLPWHWVRSVWFMVFWQIFMSGLGQKPVNRFSFGQDLQHRFMPFAPFLHCIAGIQNTQKASGTAWKIRF